MNPYRSLDNRQRAMLREMGVRVWQPPAPEPAAVAVAVLPPGAALKGPASATALVSVPAQAPAPAPAPVYAKIAIDSVASSADSTNARGTFHPQPVPAQPPVLPPAHARSDGSVVSWSAGQALALYAQATPTPGPRWLVLAETPAAVVELDTAGPDSAFNPFEGDAGRLLDNMLRAVRLHHTGSVLLAPLVRRIGQEVAPQSDVHAALASLVQSVQPDVVLVMGRLAAQAVLQSSEPFGKLRGQAHNLYGSPTVVTHDAAYLLRSPLEKARAWEDLCLAVSILPAA